MRRTVITFVLVLTFMVLAVALSVNHASADRPSDASRQDGKGSSDGIWTEVDAATLQGNTNLREIVPLSFRTVHLNKNALQVILRQAPMEFTDAARNAEVVLTLPMPDGKFARFRIVESPIMEPGLAAKFPEIKTYSGQGIDDRTATLRFDVTPAGFHAQVLSAQETIYIDPYAKGDTEHYISYYKRDVRKEGAPFECLVGTNPEADKGVDVSETQMTVPSNGATLRTYRLALAATGEYTVAAGGTAILAMARMTTSMNRVNGIFERELAVRMTFVANNSLLIYLDGATDPYTNTDGFAMMAQNQTTCDTVIGAANYDVGHVFSTGGGGIARLTSPCLEGFKAQGVTGLPNPVGDVFDVDYVAHEIGHQFGGTHTFNTVSASCGGGNRDGTSSYEPGGGTTMVAYAGICAPNDLQRNSNDYFHIKTLEQAVAFITGGGGCAAQTATGNTPPTVSAGANFTIPRNTPFTLTATSSDINGDAVTHCWEQYDLGPESPPEGDADGMARPIFRSYSPTSSLTRTFPSLTYILNNANVPPATYGCGPGPLCITGESLPNITRTMNFQVTARDNRVAGGGIVSATMMVSVDGGAGPFNVTAPNTGVVWAGGSPQTVTWSVANTTAAPVSAASVKISHSSDGGMTFPTVILASTPNDGTELITVPNIASATSRIKVEAVGNIFFDISDVNFTVTAGAVVKKPADFDGDGKTDLSVFRSGTWYIQRSTDGPLTQAFGLASDKIVPGDFDGDGKADIAVFRENADPAMNYWYVLKSGTGTVQVQEWGQQFDVPKLGDYDGDGKTDFAVFRPGTSEWWILRSSDGVPTGTAWGASGDVPLVGDFDSDNKADLTVFRPANATWFIRRSSNGTLLAQQYGASGDKLVPGDYNGDGTTDFAVFRPATNTWYTTLDVGTNYGATVWGSAGDLVVPGDYDGDGKSDLAVWRPSTGVWHIRQSSNGLPNAQAFGTTGDLPVPNSLVP